MFLTLTAINLRIFSNPLSNVLQKRIAGRGIFSTQINFLTYLGLSLLSIFCFPKFLNVTGVVWIYAILGGLFGAFGNASLIKALEGGELSVLGPINSYKPVVAMIFAVFMLGEIPSLIGILGVCLIIYGSYFLFEKGDFRISLLKRRDIQLRFVALILTAIEAVFIKNVIILTNIYTAFIFWCLFGAIFSLFITKFKFKSLCRTDFWQILALIVCTGIMQMSTNYVFARMDVSYALALFQLSALISVIFGWKFFNESNVLRKILGSGIMVLGAVILILAQ